MMKEFPCNLCGSRAVTVVYPSTAAEMSGASFACTNDGHGEHYQVVRCQACGLVFSSPRPEAGALAREYRQVEDSAYLEEMEGRFRTFDRNLSTLARFKQPGRLLDVGAAAGVFLSRAVKKGWEVRGIEPSSWGARKARELFGLDITPGTYQELAQFPRGSFDAVTMWDVLEHVDDPMEALKACRAVLKEDGVLALSTVDAGSLYARCLGPRWPWLMKMHIYYFDRGSVREYLRRAGFDVLAVRTYRHTVSLKYLEHKLGAINGALCGLVRLVRKIPGLSDGYLTVAMGDFMEVYARKGRA